MKKVVFCSVGRGVYPPYILSGPTTKEIHFFYVCLPLFRIFCPVYIIITKLEGWKEEYIFKKPELNVRSNPSDMAIENIHRQLYVVISVLGGFKEKGQLINLCFRTPQQLVDWRRRVNLLISVLGHLSS